MKYHALTLILATLLAAPFASAASRSVTSTGTPEIVVPASYGEYISGLALKSSVAQDVVVYAADAEVSITAAASASATTVSVDNAASYISNGDTVLINPSDGGAWESATVSTATTTNVVLSAGITTAVTSRSKMYPLTAAFTATVETNASDVVDAIVTRDRPGLPLYVTTSSTNCTVSVTVQ